MMLRRRDESGAVALAVALIVCFLVLPLAALAVDIGMQRVARRDVQAVADTTAMDMARILAAGASPTDAQATTSASRTSGVLGATPTVHVYSGYIAPAAAFVSDQSLGCGATHFNSYFTAVPSGQTANAVLVTATTSVPLAISGSSGAACRSSIGSARPTGCYAVRSFLLSMSTNASALNGFLNGSFGLSATAVSYQNVFNSSLSLQQLGAQLGVGSVSQLANGTFSVGTLVSGMAAVLTNNGNSSGALALRNLSASLSASTSATSVLMSRLVKLSGGIGNGAVADANINVGDLLTGVAAIADGNNFVDVPGISVAVPNLSSVGLKLKVIQPPQIACNGAPASTGQVQFQLTGQLAQLNSGLVTISAGALAVTANLANATAASTSITCTSGTPNAMVLQVTNVSTASLAIDYSGLTVSVLGLLSPQAMGPLSVSTAQPPPSGSYNLPLPTYYDPHYLNTGQSVSPIPTETASNFSILGLSLLNGGTAASLINPVITNLNSQLTSNVFPALGIQMPGADIAAEPTPNCVAPMLAG